MCSPSTWALLLRAYLSQTWPAWLQDLQSQDAHDNIEDPSPADTMDRSLGQWVFNRVEWEWNPGKKLAPDGPVICWRIPYPVVSDHEPSTACLRAWYWEIAERVQKVVFPRANQARRTETETHLTHWFWRVQWYPVYPPQVGRTMDSTMHHQGWQAAQAQDPPPDVCPCQALAARIPGVLDPSIGHIRTASITPILDAAQHDQSVIPGTKDRTTYCWPYAMKELEYAFRKGRTFRSTPLDHTWAHGVWTEAYNIVRSMTFDAMCMTELANPRRVSDFIDARIHDTAHPSGGLSLSSPPPMPQSETRKNATVVGAIRDIQSILTVTRVDKSAPNFAFVCKAYYRWAILQRLNSQDDFVRIHHPLSDPIPLHEQIWLRGLQIFGLTPDSAPAKFALSEFPTVIASVKMKKLTDPSKTEAYRASLDTWRWLTTAHKCPTKLASTLHVRLGTAVEVAYYAHCCKASLTARTRLPSHLIRRHRVKFCHQAKVVTKIIRNAPKKVTSVANGDHSKMFESLPHSGLVSIKAACLHKWNIALSERSSDALYVSLHTDHSVWSRSWVEFNHVGYVRIDTETYSAMLDFILDSAIVRVGEDGTLFRQRVGIPMGFDDSPYMSRSFFDYLDYVFVVEAINADDWDMAVSLDNMYRIADDVFCYNQEHFFTIMASSWGKIASPDGSNVSAWDFITLNDETRYATLPDGSRGAGISADMCDATISFDESGKITYEHYDKLMHMQGFSSEVIRYSASDTIGPATVLHSTVLGQMHAFAARSQTKHGMLTACCRLFIRLIGNGHNVEKIGSAVLAFSPRHDNAGNGPCYSHRYWKWDKLTCLQCIALAYDCHLAIRNLPPQRRVTLAKGVMNPELDSFVTARLAAVERLSQSC